MKKFNYENKYYLNKLNELPLSYYSKYIKSFRKFLNNKNSLFLDVGCGNGTVLSELKKGEYKNGYGIDISKLFVNEAKKKGLKNIYYYDGDKFPFKKDFFDLVGSFNVLEHTEKPEKFISNQISLLKPGGFIIVACPNFLSATIISPHPKVSGLVRRIKNFFLVWYKILFEKRKTFKRMKPIIREKFEYDDDAIVETNLIDLKSVLLNNKCRIVYESGFINYDNFFIRILNIIPLIRYSFPSCFVVAQKRNE